MDFKNMIYNFKEFANEHDLLEHIGLETRRSGVLRLVSGVGVFVSGAAIGAGIGLLFAPMRGEELRTRVKDSLKEARVRMMALRDEWSGPKRSTRKTRGTNHGVESAQQP